MSWFLTARSSTARPQPITPTIARAATSTAQYVTVCAFLSSPQPDTSTLPSSSFDNVEACRSFSHYVSPHACCFRSCRPLWLIRAAASVLVSSPSRLLFLFAFLSPQSFHRHASILRLLSQYISSATATITANCFIRCAPPVSDHVTYRGLFGLMLRRASPP